MPRTGQPAARHVAAVERAFAVLDALADGAGELGTNEIARRTGINASTVSRLLATLVGSGVVEHVPEGGKYRLGLRLVQLGNAVLRRLDLREVARPHLRALVEATGETATLSLPGEREAVTVDFAQSGSTTQSIARLGRPSVAHATATGKVMLAFGGAEPPPGQLRAYTPWTITDRRALATEIQQVRVRGHARALAEREEDLHAVAAPVWGPHDELVAILGVQGPASRFHGEAMEAALEPLLERARLVSLAFGWDGKREEAGR